MSSKRVLLTDYEGNQVMPITDAKNVYMGAGETVHDVITDQTFTAITGTIDTQPTQNSNNAVSSGSVYDALATKLDVESSANIDNVTLPNTTAKLFTNTEDIVAILSSNNKGGHIQIRVSQSGITLKFLTYMGGQRQWMNRFVSFNDVGNLTNLQTTAKSNIVAAINELVRRIEALEHNT